MVTNLKVTITLVGIQTGHCYVSGNSAKSQLRMSEPGVTPFFDEIFFSGQSRLTFLWIISWTLFLGRPHKKLLHFPSVNQPPLGVSISSLFHPWNIPASLAQRRTKHRICRNRGWPQIAKKIAFEFRRRKYFRTVQKQLAISQVSDSDLSWNFIDFRKFRGHVHPLAY